MKLDRNKLKGAYLLKSERGSWDRNRTVLKNMVQVRRGFFGRLGEKIGLVGPKMVDKNAPLRTNVGAGFGSGAGHAMVGAYSSSKCGCN